MEDGRVSGPLLICCMVYFFTMDLATGNHDRRFNISDILTRAIDIRAIMLIALPVLLMGIYGCAVTKVVAVPLRVSGAVISVVPVVGNTADAVLDTTADIID
jgi:hypothetical protein